MEVGKWRSLSRQVEGATRSLALAAQWLQLPLGPQEACSVQAPSLPSSVPTPNNYSLGLVATVMFIVALSPAIPSPTGAFMWRRPIDSPHVPGRWVFLTWKLGTAFRSGIHPASEADLTLSHQPPVYISTRRLLTLASAGLNFSCASELPWPNRPLIVSMPSSDHHDGGVCFGRMWEIFIESEH